MSTRSTTSKLATIDPDAVSQQAWQDYLRVIDEARAVALRSRWAQSPQGRAQALYYISMLQAFGFNLYMAPRQAYPTFFSHLVFTPVEYQWGAPCPDFRYHWTAIDGARTYRISGRRGNTPWLHIQAQRGWWGDADQTNIGSWDMDDFEIDADGRFEIIASPEPHPGNWMQLDPSARNTCLLVRDVWDDWDNCDGASLHIDLLDPQASDTVLLSEADINERLGKIAFQTRFSVDTFLRMSDEVYEAVGMNRFHMPNEDTTRIGGNPQAAYAKMMYELQPDEAIIIECEIPNARYWGLQLADFLYQTTDYRYHQSSLNSRQARADADGKVRIVLSAQDPGVPNWIDPAGLMQGMAQWRWYLSDRHPVPRTTVVPLSQLREHLPADTPHVSVEQRRVQLERRRRNIERRMGV